MTSHMGCCNHKKCTGRDWCHMKTGNLKVGVQSHHKDHICLRIQKKDRKGNTFKPLVYIYSCAHDGYHTFWEKPAKGVAPFIHPDDIKDFREYVEFGGTWSEKELRGKTVRWSEACQGRRDKLQADLSAKEGMTKRENRAARYELQRDAKVLKPLNHKRHKSRIEGGQLQRPSPSKKAKVGATRDVSKVVAFHCWRQRVMAYLYPFIERGECYKLLAELPPDTPPSSISTHQTTLAARKAQVVWNYCDFNNGTANPEHHCHGKDAEYCAELAGKLGGGGRPFHNLPIFSGL